MVSSHRLVFSPAIFHSLVYFLIYHLDSSLNRNVSSTTDMCEKLIHQRFISICLCSSSTSNHRKRQLPDIPQSQLHANRERGWQDCFSFGTCMFSLILVSQDLFQKATELKLRLHMQSTSAKSLLTQRSLDQRQSRTINQPRNSMVNLPTSKNSSMINLKEKPRIPMIRETSAPNASSTRRTTMVPPNEMSLAKTKLKSLEEKYRKTIRKQRNCSQLCMD